jgi:SsrA-binding protein
MVKSAPPKSRAAAKPVTDVEILYNRKLRHDFTILEAVEAGLVLMGSEVKSLRSKDVQWAQAHARFDERTGELWMYHLHIGAYLQAGTFGHLPTQPRKLLMTRRELDRLRGQMKGKGLTLIPERLFFRRGFAKVVICLCQGKDRGDKRQDLIKRAMTRDVDREVARRAKGRG